MRSSLAIACLAAAGCAAACQSLPPTEGEEDYVIDAPPSSSSDEAPPSAPSTDDGASAGEEGSNGKPGPDPSAGGAVPTAGLVAHYALDGDGKDSAADPLDAVVHGAAATADRFGRPSHALAFNGTTAYLDASAKKLPSAANPRTLSVWLRTSVTAPAYQYAANWGSSTMPGARFGVSVKGKAAGAAGVLRFSAQNQGIEGADVVADGKWHHGVVTFDGAVVSLYADGVLAQTEALSLNTTGAKLIIGRSVPTNDDGYYSGALDDVRIYDRVLSAAEIDALFREAP